jgi:hypothetical protein
MRMGIDMWIEPQYDIDGELTNPEFVDSPDDSWWWQDDGYLHTVVRKIDINNRHRFPKRIARVWHPDDIATKRQE